MSAKPTAPAPTPPEIDIASLAATAATPLEAFLDRHFKTIGYAILGLLVGAVVLWFVQYQGREKALHGALEATRAKTIEDCAIVAMNFKGSVAGGNALLMKAKLEWEQNKKDTALASLREFKANYASHPFYTQGVLSLASRLQSLDGADVKEAKALYETLAKDKDSDLAGLAQMRLGDLLWEEGKEDEAKKIYEELPRKLQGDLGQFTEENKKRLEWIAAALPTKEVDAPKVPDALKAPTPTTGSAPAINLTPGTFGAPATSAPFEVKMNPSAAGAKPGQPSIKIEPAPATNGKSPLTPNGAPVPSKSSAAPTLKLEPAPGSKPDLNAPPVKLEVKPQAAPASAPAPAAPAPAAPVPAPAAPATTKEVLKK